MSLMFNVHYYRGHTCGFPETYVKHGGPLSDMCHWDLKVCDNCRLTQLLCFWTLSIVLFFYYYLRQRFGDLILSGDRD
jgi:hypothetical protein